MAGGRKGSHTADAVEGREPCLQRKVRDRGARREKYKNPKAQSHGPGKCEGLIFLSPCDQPGLKTGVLKVGGLG